jgi:hypothetical protein
MRTTARNVGDLAPNGDCNKVATRPLAWMYMAVPGRCCNLSPHLVGWLVVFDQYTTVCTNGLRHCLERYTVQKMDPKDPFTLPGTTISTARGTHHDSIGLTRHCSSRNNCSVESHLCMRSTTDGRLVPVSVRFPTLPFIDLLLCTLFPLLPPRQMPCIFLDCGGCKSIKFMGWVCPRYTAG